MLGQLLEEGLTVSRSPPGRSDVHTYHGAIGRARVGDHPHRKQSFELGIPKESEVFTATAWNRKVNRQRVQTFSLENGNCVLD